MADKQTLANFVDGHAAVRPEVALAIAQMLDGQPLPEVPAEGNGGSGEVHVHVRGESRQG